MISFLYSNICMGRGKKISLSCRLISETTVSVLILNTRESTDSDVLISDNRQD